MVRMTQPVLSDGGRCVCASQPAVPWKAHRRNTQEQAGHQCQAREHGDNAAENLQGARCTKGQSRAVHRAAQWQAGRRAGRTVADHALHCPT